MDGAVSVFPSSFHSWMMCFLLDSFFSIMDGVFSVR